MSEQWEPWARCYLKVSVDGLTPSALESALGLATRATTAGDWIVDLERGSDETLENQIMRAGEYLESVEAGLQSLGPTAQIALVVSWTPRPGQDGLAFPPQVLAALGALGAMIKIDTYTDD